MSQPTSPGTTGLVDEIQRNDAARRDEVMALQVVEAIHCTAIYAPRDGDVRICASVGPAGEVIAVWAAAPDLEAATSRTGSPGGATFPDARSPRPFDVRVTVQAPDGRTAVTPIAGLGLANITAQPLPGDRILIVGARSYWRPEGADRNAVGGYGPDRDRLVVGELRDGAFQQADEYRVVLPGGADIPSATHVIGRGSTLHFLTGSEWYWLNMGMLRLGSR